MMHVSSPSVRRVLFCMLLIAVAFFGTVFADESADEVNDEGPEDDEGGKKFGSSRWGTEDDRGTALGGDMALLVPFPVLCGIAGLGVVGFVAVVYFLWDSVTKPEREAKAKKEARRLKKEKNKKAR
eukprot:TRINITY_DN15406_c0_g1_i1.p1 TRINITY_DN15406_c0_g1~~TRINITY_DN15406_c0_g1_i1.p1  ORF type:complete len:141 (-),score=44.49 TRINITY_DN15406_c0_g1_i1:66-443(-)